MGLRSYDRSCCHSTDSWQTLKSRHCWLSGYLVARTGCCRQEWPFAVWWVDTADEKRTSIVFFDLFNFWGDQIRYKIHSFEQSNRIAIKRFVCTESIKITANHEAWCLQKEQFWPKFSFFASAFLSHGMILTSVSQVSCLINLISISWEGLAHCCWLPLMRIIVVDLTNLMNNFMNSWTS